MARNPKPSLDKYPFHIENAINAYLDDGYDAGAEALGPVATLLWTARNTRVKIPYTVARTDGSNTGRSFSITRAAATYQRDHFHCRYCGGKLIPVSLLSLVHDVYPSQLPYRDTYKHGCLHPVFYMRGAEADHIEPGSVGGRWTEPDNHAAACWRCNTMKHDYSLDELGWELLATPQTGWDGLISLYQPLFDAAGQPRPGYHKRWIRALAG